MSNRPVLAGGDVFGLSDSLWGDVPLDFIFGCRDRNIGWGLKDDFTSYGYTAALQTSLGLYNSEGNQYRTFEYMGSAQQSIIPSDTIYTVPTGFPILTPQGQKSAHGGTTELFAAGSTIWTPGQLVFTPTAENDQCQIQAGPYGAAGNVCPFHVYPGRSGNLYFECRLKFSALATGFTTFFIGLAGTGSAVTSRPAASTAYDTNTNLLGFGCRSGDTTETLSWVVNKAGGTVSSQNVSNMAGLNILTLLGSTGDYTKGYLNIGDGVYFKLGFKYDGRLKTCTPYINGVPQDGVAGPNKSIGAGTLSTNMGTAAPGTGSSTLWPLTGMTLAAGLFQTSSTYQTVTLDGWAVAQTP